MADNIERVARVLSLIAIPVIIALSGKMIEDALARREVSQKYVEIALSILTKSEDTGEDPLRKWAVALLDDNSPTRFDEGLFDQLVKGETVFPTRSPNPVGAPLEMPDPLRPGSFQLQAYDDGRIRIVRRMADDSLEVSRIDAGILRPITDAIVFKLDRMHLLAISDEQNVWILSFEYRGARLLVRLGFVNQTPKSIEVDPALGRLHIRLNDGKVLEHDLYTLLGFDPTVRSPV